MSNFRQVQYTHQQQPASPSHPHSPQSNQHVVIRGADGLAYRRSVQVFIVNEHGEYLVCCPVGSSNRDFRQTVQGGSAPGETPQATAIRETWEEVGLDLSVHGFYIADVLPLWPSLQGPPLVGTSSSVLGDAVQVNERGELVTEERAPFRYLSKKWKKEGISGQEMYPVLYYVPREDIRYMRVYSRERGVRQEFRVVYWGSLTELAQCAPPVKMQLMENVCPAVAVAVQPFLRENRLAHYRS